MIPLDGITLTADQRQAISFGERPGRHIHVGGSMRSGKTMVAVFGFLWWAGSHYTRHNFLLCSKSATQFQSVTLGYVRAYAEWLGLGLSRQDRCWRLESDDGGFNDFYPVLFSGSASGGVGAAGGALPASRLEGTDAAGALVDEACECPDLMMKTISDRCSVRGSKIAYSYYPQGTQHPLKTGNYDKVVDGTLSGEFHHLAMEDNPGLSDEYIAEQKAKWAPVPHEYKRRIEASGPARRGWCSSCSRTI